MTSVKRAGLTILAALTMGTAAAAALAEEGWPSRPVPPGTVSVPVLAASDQALEPGRVQVCMDHGARPQSYEMISRICRGGGDTCTVFVAVPVEDARYRLITYDVANPPVIATSPDACMRPAFVSQGTFSPSGN